MKSDSWPIVVVGASAGGVEALTVLMRGLPASLQAAVFIVLHIPADTPSQLATILQRATSLPVGDAQDGEPIRSGRAYVAQADRHLMVEADRIRITRGPKECRVRPAIDVLFRSAAVAFGPRAIGVVLSGMLDDGTAGLWAVKDCGGVALVQDPDSAQYRSMPQSARRNVEVDRVLPLEELAAEIVRVAAAPPRRHAKPASASLQIENGISMEGNALQAGVMRLGKVSQYTCPDCHGVLVQIEEGPFVRFRCHTGHAFSLNTLLAEVNESIDNGLWDTLRSIEERILLLRQMADLVTELGHPDVAAQCIGQADHAEEKVQPLRSLVLDPQLFGHTPEGQRS